MPEEASQPESLVGRVLSSYRIERELGAGGMGAVYAASHVRTGRPYAVKVLLRAHAEKKEALRRFRREAEALSALGHQHIVAIHDFDETPDGLFFLAMERLEGEDLAHRLAKVGRFAWPDALRLWSSVASALEAAHAIGLIHRDLKPANVFLASVPGADAERPVLLDFGLARALEPDGKESRVTATGTVLGTPAYMSPEQAQGSALDARSDVWALGILLHELCAGRPPFVAPTIASTFVQILTAPTPRLRVLGLDVPEALDDAIVRALEKSPEARFADVAAMRRAVAGLLPSSSTSAPSPVLVLPKTAAATPATVLLASDARRGGIPAWVLAAVGIAVLLALGSAGLGAFWLLRSRPAAVAIGPPTPLPDATEPVSAPPPAAPPATPPEPEPAPALTIAEEAAAEAEAARVSSRALAGDDRPARRRPEPAREPADEPAPSPEAIAEPAAAPAGGPPPALVRATERMGEGDFAGCLRELAHAGTSAPILGARMSCARSAGDHAELEATCELLHRHHPTHAYTRTCDTLLGVTP